MKSRYQRILLLLLAIWLSPLASAQTPVTTLDLFTATPTATPTTMPTTEDPIQRHLALIVGVPTGVGLAVIGLLACGLWLVCSTYCENRQTTEQSGAGTGTGTGTHSTNVRQKGKNRPVRSGGTSAVESSSTIDPTRYEPEPRHQASLPSKYKPDPTQFEPDSTHQATELTQFEPDPSHDVVSEPTEFEPDSTHQVSEPTQFEPDSD